MREGEREREGVCDALVALDLNNMSPGQTACLGFIVIASTKYNALFFLKQHKFEIVVCCRF